MQTIRLIADRQRRFALHCVEHAEEGSVVTIRPPKRSIEQNNKMWAMLADIAKSKPEGRQWTPETWKCAFMNARGHQIKFAEALDGSGPFPMGFKTSQLGIREMADLITFIQEYGDRHFVKWNDTLQGGWYE